MQVYIIKKRQRIMSNNSGNHSIAHRIAEARTAANISHSQLAESLQLSISELEGVELGRRKISTLELAQIAKLLRQPVYALTGFSSELSQEFAISELEVNLNEFINTKGQSSNDECVSQILELALKAYRAEEITSGKLRDICEHLEIPFSAVQADLGVD